MILQMKPLAAYISSLAISTIIVILMSNGHFLATGAFVAGMVIGIIMCMVSLKKA